MANELSFERAAYLRQPMPAGLYLAEQNTCLALRFLYAEFGRGVINKEQAALEKRKLLEQMEHELKIDKLNEQISQLWKRIEQSARDYAMNPTKETADTFYARVYNLGDDWRNDRTKKAVDGVAWERNETMNTKEMEASG